MKLELYEAIIKTLNGSRLKKLKWVKEVQQTHLENNISDDTLLSIYSQYQQRKVKRTFQEHHRKKNMARYYRRFIEATKRQEKGILIKMARDMDFPPTLVARIILEEYFKETLFTDTGVVPKGFISKYIKDPTLITDTYLRQQVELSIQEDDICGPLVDHVKHETGEQHEQLLHRLLTEKDIAYSDEEVLRREGYDKTPDFKLLIPIGVNDRVVNWIESKASFGDEESHAGYLENQFWSYTNRYGPGLVIYWFGFLEELNTNVEQGIMLVDGFPEGIVTLEELLDEDEDKTLFML